MDLAFAQHSEEFGEDGDTQGFFCAAYENRNSRKLEKKMKPDCHFDGGCNVFSGGEFAE